MYIAVKCVDCEGHDPIAVPWGSGTVQTTGRRGDAIRCSVGYGGTRSGAARHSSVQTTGCHGHWGTDRLTRSLTCIS